MAESAIARKCAIFLLAAPVVLLSACSPAQSPAPAVPANALTAQLNAPDGSQVAAATIEFKDGFATVTVQTTEGGKLAPGPHGLHIHTVGRCETNSVAPAGGAPGNFLSAGGHRRCCRRPR